MKKITVNNLKVDDQLFNFINDEVIPGTNIEPNNFWDSFDKVVHELKPINKKLLDKRKEIQKKMDEWYLSKKDKKFSSDEYLKFLKSIGYIVDEKEDSCIYSNSLRIRFVKRSIQDVKCRSRY